MSIAIPGALGLFSLLQEAFCHVEASRSRARLAKAVHGFLDNFWWLANNDIASHPTQIARLVPSNPGLLGAYNAAVTFMGGVAFIPTDNREDDVVPILWLKPFTDSIQWKLVSFANPDRSINNSDLELCGNIAHNDVVA